MNIKVVLLSILSLCFYVQPAHGSLMAVNNTRSASFIAGGALAVTATLGAVGSYFLLQRSLEVEKECVEKNINDKREALKKRKDRVEKNQILQEIELLKPVYKKNLAEKAQQQQQKIIRSEPDEILVKDQDVMSAWKNEIVLNAKAIPQELITRFNILFEELECPNAHEKWKQIFEALDTITKSDWYKRFSAETKCLTTEVERLQAELDILQLKCKGQIDDLLAQKNSNIKILCSAAGLSYIASLSILLYGYFSSQQVSK